MVQFDAQMYINIRAEREMLIDHKCAGYYSWQPLNVTYAYAQFKMLKYATDVRESYIS